MMRRIWKGITAGAISLALAGPALADSLTDALIGAYRSSGLIEQNQALVRAADEDVASAIASLRPVLSYAASGTWSEPVGLTGERYTNRFSLELDWLLFDSGQTKFSIDAAKEAVLAAREALRGVEQQVLLRAVEAYFDVLRATEFVDLADGSVRVISEELRATQDRFEVGEVTRTDIALAEARLAASRSSRAAAEGDLSRAREEYRAVVGRYPGPLEPAPPAPAAAGSLEQAVDVARRRHPAIAEAQRQTQVAELRILQATAAMGPSLSATASSTWDEYFDEATNSVGLNFGGPIYRGGALSSAVRQARAQRDAQRAALHDTVRQVEQQVGNAWSVLRVTDASIAANRREVEASEVALSGTTEESRLGARTTLDVLNAEQDLLDARANLVSTQIDRQVAAYALWQTMGILTVEELNLGIATYDPADYYNAVKNAPVRNVSPQGQKLDSVLKRLLR